MTQMFPTAIQMGLMSGFALQDGDLLAKLLAGAGNFGGAPGVGGSAAGAVGGTNAATAGALTSSINVMTGLTATTNSFSLPNTQAGKIIRIYNDSTVAMQVFPPAANQTIDTAAAGAAVTLSPGARCDYVFMGNNSWVSDLLGSPSA